MTNEKETKQDINDILPPATVMERLVEKIPDKNVQSNIYVMLRDFDLQAVESPVQLAKGLQALTAMALYIGPYSKDFRDSFELARKCIDSYAKIMQAFLHKEFPRRTRQLFIDILEILRVELPSERYEQIKRMIEDEIPL